MEPRQASQRHTLPGVAQDLHVVFVRTRSRCPLWIGAEIERVALGRPLVGFALPAASDGVVVLPEPELL
eukprot:2166341-Alexandrium_andersonii.AAC.1